MMSDYSKKRKLEDDKKVDNKEKSKIAMEAIKKAKEAAKKLQNIAKPSDHKPPSLAETLLHDEKPSYKAFKGELPFTHRIDINESKHRYNLMRAQTQEEIHSETGALIVTRGRYYPDRRLASEKDPPLYLHIAAATQESLKKATDKIEAILNEKYIPQDPNIAKGYRVIKVYVDIDTDRLFNVRGKLLGPQGAYLRHIFTTSGAKIQLRGKGSGFVEPNTGAEATDPLHFYIASSDNDSIEKARRLSLDLIHTVRQDFERHKMNPLDYLPENEVLPTLPGTNLPPIPGTNASANATENAEQSGADIYSNYYNISYNDY